MASASCHSTCVPATSFRGPRREMLLSRSAPPRLSAAVRCSLDSQVGADENLLVKEHTHTFVNKGGEIGELDFRFPVGAPIHVIRAFLATTQLKPYDKAWNAFALALSPVVCALVDPNFHLDYIDSMEGATLSGRRAAAYVCSAGEELAKLGKKLASIDSGRTRKDSNAAEELSLV